MEIVTKFFKGKKNFYLDPERCIQLYMDTSNPRVEVRFKFSCDYHLNQVIFTKKTWNKILDNAKVICEALAQDVGKIIFINNEVKVFTQRIGDQRELIFLDMKGTHINLDLDAFKQLIFMSLKVAWAYRELEAHIYETTDHLKALLNSVSAQCNQSAINDEGFLSDLQKRVEDLNPGSNSSTVRLRIINNSEHKSDNNAIFVLRASM